MFTAKTKFAVVYDLCQYRALPILVTDMISEYLDDEIVFTISTLSRALNASANAIIYRDIICHPADAPAFEGQKAVQLLRSLLSNPTLANHIKSLTVTGEIQLEDEDIGLPWPDVGPPEVLVTLADFSSEDLEGYKRTFGLLPSPSDRHIFLQTLVLNILGLVPNLEELYIGSEYFYHPDFRAGMRTLIGLGGLEHLRKCSLHLDLLLGLHGWGKDINVVQCSSCLSLDTANTNLLPRALEAAKREIWHASRSTPLSIIIT